MRESMAGLTGGQSRRHAICPGARQPGDESDIGVLSPDNLGDWRIRAQGDVSICVRAELEASTRARSTSIRVPCSERPTILWRS